MEMITNVLCGCAFFWGESESAFPQGATTLKTCGLGPKQVVASLLHSVGSGPPWSPTPGPRQGALPAPDEHDADVLRSGLG